jgi:hypothetical protein
MTDAPDSGGEWEKPATVRLFDFVFFDEGGKAGRERWHIAVEDDDGFRPGLNVRVNQE